MHFCAHFWSTRLGRISPGPIRSPIAGVRIFEQTSQPRPRKDIGKIMQKYGIFLA